MKINFEGGFNIAMKIPPEKYNETVAFYRDILLFDVEEVPIDHPTVLATHRLIFGPNILWLECVKELPHQQIWLEMTTDDVDSSTRYLQTNEVLIADDLEKIDTNNMHWIKDPAGSVLLLKSKAKGQSDGAPQPDDRA